MENYGNGLGWAMLFIFGLLLMIGTFFIMSFEEEPLIDNNQTRVIKIVDTQEKENIKSKPKERQSSSYEEAFKKTFKKRN